MQRLLCVIGSFDPRNFTPGGLGGDDPWSFNRVTLDGARAMEGERAEARPFLEGPLAPVTGAVIEFEDLLAFSRNPVKAFLRQRLGFSLGMYSDEVDDDLPIELDALQRWQIGQRMLEARLAGATPDASIAAARARGSLPPGKLDEPILATLLPDVEEIVRHTTALLPGAAEPGSVDVRVMLPDGRRVNGTVPDVCGDLLRSVSFSRVNARQRLVAWVRFLALTAAHPDRPFEAATVGRAGYPANRHAAVTVVRLPRLAPALALEHLTALVGLFDAGMREPLPIACKTSAAYAQALHSGGDPVKDATKKWESGWDFSKEDQEPEHELVFGAGVSLEQLMARAGFDTYARRLWDPVLAWEQVEHR